MNTWSLTARGPAASYVEHSDRTVPGTVRHQLVTRALINHLPGLKCRVLDVGGGAGHQAIAVARAGHNVVLLDPDREMLETAGKAIAREPRDVRLRIETVLGGYQDISSRAGQEFDAVLSHGVLMYLDDVAAALQSIVTSTVPGGIVSILTKNASSLAMRAGLEGRWEEARALMDRHTETNRLGVQTRAHTVEQISKIIESSGAKPEMLYGVQLFADPVIEELDGSQFARLFELEWEAGKRDPYRQVARLFHLIARRGV